MPIVSHATRKQMRDSFAYFQSLKSMKKIEKGHLGNT